MYVVKYYSKKLLVFLVCSIDNLTPFISIPVPLDPETQPGPRSGLFIVLKGRLYCVNDGSYVLIHLY